MRLGVVVLAAGKGTRMGSDLPKVLHPLGGIPLIQHILGAIAPLQPHRQVLVVGHGQEPVRQALAGARLLWAEQREQLGTGHALLQARPILAGEADTILALYGDVPLIRSQTLADLLTHHREARATITFLTHRAEDATGYGRILRDGEGRALAIVEEKDASPVQRRIPEVNCGFYCIEADWAWSALERLKLSPQGEYYLTDLLELAVGDGVKVETFDVKDGEEIMGINDRIQLAKAEEELRRRKLEELMRDGVTVLDPSTTYVEPSVRVGEDSTLLPGCVLQGQTEIGPRCTIGPYSLVRDCRIGSGCTVTFSVLEESTVEANVHIGPFSHLRPGAYIEEDTHIGNFVEVKNSRLGRRVHAGHFSYLGDATIGERVNIGAGTITCNFDGRAKHPTTIEEGAFIGSDTLLVAPVRVGAGAHTGAGTVVTKDIPPRTLAVGIPGRVIRRLEEG